MSGQSYVVRALWFLVGNVNELDGKGRMGQGAYLIRGYIHFSAIQISEDVCIKSCSSSKVKEEVRFVFYL